MDNIAYDRWNFIIAYRDRKGFQKQGKNYAILL